MATNPEDRAPENATGGETATRVSPPTATSEPPHGDPFAAAVPTPQAEGEPGEATADADPAAAAPETGSTSGGELDELIARAQKADEYLELAQRTKADFENFRKRAARENALAQERGVARLAKELLPAVDNLDRALEAAEAGGGDGDGAEPDSSLISGIKLVHAEVLTALQRAGIERFEPGGEPFDPQHHEAVAQHPFPGVEAGTIVEVYQRGYRIGDTVLRPARVVVAG